MQPLPETEARTVSRRNYSLKRDTDESAYAPRTHRIPLVFCFDKGDGPLSRAGNENNVHRPVEKRSGPFRYLHSPGCNRFFLFFISAPEKRESK